MSLLGTLTRPNSLSVTFKPIASSAAMILDLSGRNRTPNTQYNVTPGRRGVYGDKKKYAPSTLGGTKKIEDVFIKSLIIASSCPQHSSRCSFGSLAWITYPPRKRRARQMLHSASRRDFSTKPNRKQAAALAVPQNPDEISRAEYKDLINLYDSPSDLWEQPQSKPHHFPLAPRLVVPPDEEGRPSVAPRQILAPEDKDHSAQLNSLYALLSRSPGRISHVQLWNAYQALQLPRLRYIPDRQIRRFFNHLNWVEFRHVNDAMPRYFSLLDDCLGEEIAVTTAEWNNAIAFAGRWTRYATSKEVKGAVETWMRMEQAGKQANHATFNILFGVAVRAGRFALADTIHNELRARGMPLNRYFRASMIYYAGTRGDGDGVRQAFRDLVDSGEIVDTSVMNCVILSLVRAGEPAAAEHVFSKMKRLYEQKMGTAGPAKWQDQRKLGGLLHRTSIRLRKERAQHEKSFFGTGFSADSKREEVQKATPIAPNARTYRILIQHHAYTSGDIDRIRQLLKEMKETGLHIHGSVYHHLFRGFWQHGGYAFTAWGRKSLEEFWNDFLAAEATNPQSPQETDSITQAQMSETERTPYFTSSLAISVLSAFYKCAGKTRMLDVWRQIQTRWQDMNDEDRAKIRNLTEKFVREDSVYIT